MNKILISALMLLASAGMNAQNFSIEHQEFAAGGGPVANGRYSVSGSISPISDSGPKPAGGPYPVDSGFWSVVTSIQTPEGPILLTITRNGDLLSHPGLLQRANLFSNPRMTSQKLSHGCPFRKTRRFRTAI